MTAPFDLPDFDAHEGVHFFEDAASGLRAIIAIHSTALGPAAGGTRFWHYATNAAAVTDALRLSRGMSYKNAMADLPLGGGKGVILAPADRVKTPAMLAAYGRAVDRLGGSYVTAEDVGIGDQDMVAIARETRFVSGLPVADAGSAGGDPGPYTARGVWLGVKAALERRNGPGVAGAHVVIQGVGSVGGGLARLLAGDGVRLTIADLDPARAGRVAEETGAEVVPLDRIMTVAADLFSPNALGAVLTAETIPALGAPVVAGGANNQLATPEDALRVQEAGILYAPDYVINAGGIINVGLEYLGQGSAGEVNARIDRIPERLAAIWDESEATGLPAAEVADRQARRRVGREG